MTFQNSVARFSGAGVQGEIIADSPYRAQPYELVSSSAANNVIGATYCTVVSEGVAQAGGTGYGAGIISNPKTQVSYGTTQNGTLAPTLTLPNYKIASLLQAGTILVYLPAAANIGDIVQYNTTTGALSTIPASPTPTPSSGCAIIPNAFVEKYTDTAAGLAVIHINA